MNQIENQNVAAEGTKEVAKVAKRIIIRDRIVVAKRCSEALKASPNKEVGANFLRVKLVTEEMISAIASEIGQQNSLMDFMFSNGYETDAVAKTLVKYGLCVDKIKDGEIVATALTLAKGRAKRHVGKDYFHVIDKRSENTMTVVKKVQSELKPEQMVKYAVC
jgi:hypothetical protein